MEPQRIYLIAPNPLLALDLKRLLRRLGLEGGIRFQSIQEAWLAIQYAPPDTLVFDHSDPDCTDMLDWITRIRVRFQFPIVLLSTWTRAEFPPIFHQMEFTTILEKPFPDWEFLEIMDRFGFSE